MVRTGPDLAAFSRWVRLVLKTMKSQHGWGITRVATESGVARSTITLWRDADWSKGPPTRSSVERFCKNLKLKPEAPFAFMGWVLAPRETTAAAGAAAVTEESELVRRIRLMELALDQPRITPERRRDLERTLNQLHGLLDVTWDTELEDELRREA
ncbi:phosphoenolpyruvate carboxylase [Glycomyces paridis]|uniref:Phosphoenolpyruvate carboxylase n=1 Tax=Glycomyces paridis TaxID=2126555 RepID=A0A4S8PHN6_9ACTN|nr:phosphoenolpyruvate carboxylase [Glycomyces paridis]THV27909.1 phosphoenolpyruvate carboxylase [Glycomyces paridis]